MLHMISNTVKTSRLFVLLILDQTQWRFVWPAEWRETYVLSDPNTENQQFDLIVTTVAHQIFPTINSIVKSCLSFVSLGNELSNYRTKNHSDFYQTLFWVLNGQHWPRLIRLKMMWYLCLSKVMNLYNSSSWTEGFHGTVELWYI